MTASRSANPISRRTALAGLGAGSLGLALAAPSLAVSAQEEPGDLADHPLTGAWLALANAQSPGDPPAPVPSVYTPDGIVVLAFPVSQAGAQGVTYGSSAVGTWESAGERTGSFTTVQTLSDANGALVGTVTVEGHPTVSEDGQTFVDDDPETTVTIRDPLGNIVQVIPGDASPPVYGTRIGVGSVVYPAATPAAGTPAT